MAINPEVLIIMDHLVVKFWLLNIVALMSQFRLVCFVLFFGLQCFDAVGWAAGRASGL